ncbi:hypothetical protein NDU88_001644 [Pleurodeles waltl]|uniref:Endonuclease/exonuclease/phosphatase domain-containing protein n=1 Tax=Pleurodeles waltl TaxID=8319 RepID=A0AAV7KQR5_PLEWA|nr:hypothetical protein NDU88_001644 [Pleurodeles waltl]
MVRHAHQHKDLAVPGHWLFLEAGRSNPAWDEEADCVVGNGWATRKERAEKVGCMPPLRLTTSVSPQPAGGNWIGGLNNIGDQIHSCRVRQEAAKGRCGRRQDPDIILQENHLVGNCGWRIWRRSMDVERGGPCAGILLHLPCYLQPGLQSTALDKLGDQIVALPETLLFIGGDLNLSTSGEMNRVMANGKDLRQTSALPNS